MLEKITGTFSEIVKKLSGKSTITEKNIEEYKLRKKSIDDMVQKKKATEDFKAWFDTDFIKRNPMPDNKDK